MLFVFSVSGTFGLASNGSVSPTVDAKLVPPISVIIILFSVVHVPVDISNAILKCCST